MTEAVPPNGRILRNLAMASNYLMSHILHFYHLVALDYVDVNGTGLIPKGFLCPNYDSNYYARGIDPVLQTGGLGAPAYTVNNAPNANPGIPAGALGDLTPYLAGQYVRALKFRRLAHQIGALFAGKMPQASAYTPGCMTTKPYDPTPGGVDAAVVDKFHEIMYGGPGFTATNKQGQTSGATHPFNGIAISVSNPHPESMLGFIGRPSDFWQWARYGFGPAHLPAWAKAGVPGAAPGTAGCWWNGTAHTGPTFTGTFLFDTVAAAHVFPEYFWFGSGYGRHLAWGIFEGASDPSATIEAADAALAYPDKRAITRGRTIVPVNPNGSLTPYSYTHLAARHLDAREFTPNSRYDDTKGDTQGRHMWGGKTKALAFGNGKAAAYTYAKTPRYDSVGNGDPADFVAYEVGPLARMMSNASGLSNPGGPAVTAEVLAVDAGAAGAYYPGILADVDGVLGGAFGMGAIGVFPGWGANLTGHLTFLQTAIPGSPVFYLPPNALPATALNNTFANDYMGDATLDRIAARSLETYYVARQMVNWFAAIDPSKKSNKSLFFDWGGGKLHPMPKNSAKGAGLTEAPRGALGHWIKIGKPKKNAKFKKYKGKTSNYQIITPTAWNISPIDHLGNHGPAEKCLLDTPVVSTAEPIEVLRVIHSFDFCCACTVHVFNAKKEKTFEATLETLP